MLSITKTAEFLKIPKPRLYKLLEEEGINTIQHGVRKLINRDDIERLSSLIESERKKKAEEQLLFSSESLQGSNSNRASKSSVDSSVDDVLVQKLLSEKDRQIQRLESQLDSEKTERHNLQQGLLNLQAVMMKLDQRISLLQEPEVKQESESIKPESGFKDIEEAELVGKIQPEAVSPSSRSFLSPVIWLVLLMIAVVTAFEFGGGNAADLLRNLLASS